MTYRFAKKPPQVIAINGARELLLADNESDPAHRAFRRRREQLKVRPIETPPRLKQYGKCRRAPEPVALVRADRNGQGCGGSAGRRAQTASRTRPFARRARRTLRPPILFMRARKPWVRLRRTTEGW